MRHTRRLSTIATRQSRRRRVDGNIYLVLLESPGGNIEITEVVNWPEFFAMLRCRGFGKDSIDWKERCLTLIASHSEEI
jgi:hypothetical protein